jgi:transcriptional regulator with XRE-family HTH domain
LTQQANIFKMKQPELGKRIAELRQSQGLTQEELVEKCNLNVRTIQRIESGEVTPRNYTIKAIFDALGASFEELLNPPVHKVKLNDTLLITGIIGGILYLFTGIPESTLEYLRFSEEVLDFTLNPFSDVWYVLIKVLAVGGLVALMAGFYHVANRYQLGLLKIGTLSLGIVALVFGLLDLISLQWTFIEVSHPVYVFGLLSLFALAGVVFGVALILSRDAIGDLALIAGIFELLIAACLMSVFLAIFGILLLIPATILEINWLSWPPSIINRRRPPFRARSAAMARNTIQEIRVDLISPCFSMISERSTPAVMCASTPFSSAILKTFRPIRPKPFIANFMISSC